MSNLRRLAATLWRLQHEAATGKCAMCDRPSVGYIQPADWRPRGCCQFHKDHAPAGYVVHPDPWAEP